MCESLLCERSCHCHLSVTVFCACSSCLWDRVSHHLAVISAVRVNRVCEIESVITSLLYQPHVLLVFVRSSQSSSRCFISRACYSCLWDRVRVIISLTINRICLSSLWDRARVSSSVCLSLTINRVCPSCLLDRVTVIWLDVYQRHFLALECPTFDRSGRHHLALLCPRVELASEIEPRT